MPTLIQVSPDDGNRLIGVDGDGHIWRGLMKRDKSGEEYIVWKSIRSEFEEPK
jgi:hypothetical protein